MVTAAQQQTPAFHEAPALAPARSLTADRASRLIDECAADLRGTIPGTFSTRWHERARERLAREPAHANVNALWFSLEAVDEAVAEGRAFSWACSDREKTAALDRSVIRAAGGLV